eukprot:1233895-Pleurochrysis_carterae.AAC.5
MFSWRAALGSSVADARTQQKLQEAEEARKPAAKPKIVEEDIDMRLHACVRLSAPVCMRVRARVRTHVYARARGARASTRTRVFAAEHARHET